MHLQRIPGVNEIKDWFQEIEIESRIYFLRIYILGGSIQVAATEYNNRNNKEIQLFHKIFCQGAKARYMLPNHVTETTINGYLLRAPVSNMHMHTCTHTYIHARIHARIHAHS